MTTKPIVESGMSFGPYPDGHVFYIEKSATYRKVQDSLPMAELVLLHAPQAGAPPVVWVVEAKSSSPRPGDPSKLDDFIGQIRDKLSNALSLGLAACLKRHPTAEAELPDPFKSLDLATVGFRLVLVIKGHQEEWLPPLQEALQKALRSTAVAWAQTKVVVLNDGGARKRGLIT